VVLAPVGEANVISTMLETGSSLGGEGSSGGVIFPDFSYCRDGLLAAALLVRSLRSSSLSDILADLPSYSLERLKMTAERPAFERGLESMRREHPDSITLDGIRIDGSHGWMLFRPSRTEDAVRISVETKDPKDLQAAVDEAKALLARAMSPGAAGP
jgi:phosphomannomutase